MNDLVEIRKRQIADGYYDKKFPSRVKVDGSWVFYWQSAYADAFDKHDMLPGDVYDGLYRYCRRGREVKEIQGTGMEKCYVSADAAIFDLYRVIFRYQQGLSLS